MMRRNVGGRIVVFDVFVDGGLIKLSLKWEYRLSS